MRTCSKCKRAKPDHEFIGLRNESCRWCARCRGMDRDRKRNQDFASRSSAEILDEAQRRRNQLEAEGYDLSLFRERVA